MATVQPWVRPYKRRKQPKDMNGQRILVLAKSVGTVRRALQGVSGIKRVRCAGSDGNSRVVEVIHTNYRRRCWGMFDALRRFDRPKLAEIRRRGW